jgi:hypothetical protein
MSLKTAAGAFLIIAAAAALAGAVPRNWKTIEVVDMLTLYSGGDMVGILKLIGRIKVVYVKK